MATKHIPSTQQLRSALMACEQPTPYVHDVEVENKLHVVSGQGLPVEVEHPMKGQHAW